MRRRISKCDKLQHDIQLHLSSLSRNKQTFRQSNQISISKKYTTSLKMTIGEQYNDVRTLIKVKLRFAEKHGELEILISLARTDGFFSTRSMIMMHSTFKLHFESCLQIGNASDL